MNDSIVRRGFDRVRALVGIGPQSGKPLSAKQLQHLRQQLKECADGRGGEVSARQRAVRLGASYLGLDDNGRREFLRLIANR